MKDIKEYLHFYLGCECKGEGSMIYKLSGITTDCKGNDKYFLIDSHGFTCVDVDFKPILRRLDSMTEEEAKEYFNLHKTAIVTKIRKYKSTVVVVEYKWIHDNPEIKTADGYCYSEVGISTEGSFKSKQFAWLLSKGFWIFDESAFDKGLIIDSMTLNKEV